MRRRADDDEVVFAAAQSALGADQTETIDSRDHGLAKPVLKAERAASVVSGCARVTQGRGAAT